MGLLNSALQIGRSAIIGYQNAMQIVGSNISGAGDADYTRLRPDLTPLQGTLLAEGIQPGAGVALTDIRRSVDEALESRLRLANADFEAVSAQQRTMAEMETLFDDLNGAGLDSRLSEFFHSFDDLSNSPEDPASRDLAISRGVQLSESLQSLRSSITRLSNDADSQITALVSEAEMLGEEIARLNLRITEAEAGSGKEATGLRDQRDGALRELSNYFDVTVRSVDDGSVNVYIGSETLIQGNDYRGLLAVEEVAGELTRTTVRFADSEAAVGLRGGRIGGLVAARDNFGFERIAELDRMTDALIHEVNVLHADGQGLDSYTSLVGDIPIIESGVPLNAAAAGLPHPPQHGSFYITVADDATATPLSYRIEVDLDGEGDDTTFDSLIADINDTVEGVTASMTPDGRLSLVADAGRSFTFGHDGQQARSDTSGVLAALGVNTFFTGSDASNIAVSQTIQAKPTLLAASSVFLAGDATQARKIAELDTAGLDLLNGSSVSRFYGSIATSVAVETAAINEDVNAASAVLSNLSAQRESVSGVSLDEEAISLLKYERAFQGMSRFVRAVDDMLAELVSLVR